VVRQGEVGPEMYFISEGTLEVCNQGTKSITYVKHAVYSLALLLPHARSYRYVVSCALHILDR
jgi:hypothetical protein